jgi:hypothetical protein
MDINHAELIETNFNSTTMSTLLIFHEVKDGDQWAKAWRKGPNSRHELFAKYDVKARTFRDPENSNNSGVLLEVSDMDKFRAALASPEGQKAMAEDGLKIETMRMLTEFTP